MVKHTEEEIKPEIIEKLEESDNFLERLVQHYGLSHDRAHAFTMDQLEKDGIVTRDKQGIRDLSGLKKKENRKKALELMVKHLDEDLQKQLGKELWDRLDDRWKEFYRKNVMGYTKQSLQDAIETYKHRYTSEAHKKEHEKMLGHIQQDHLQAHLGLVKAEHAQDVFKHYFKVDKKYLENVDWDVIQRNDSHLQQMVVDYLKRGKRSFDEDFFEGQVWYKSSSK